MIVRDTLNKLVITGWVLILLCFTLATTDSASAQEAVVSYTRVGQQMPLFSVRELGGTNINIESLKGKVVMVTFWATWCSPCLTELPRLEKDIWQIFKSDDFVMIAIAREQSDEEISAFKLEHRLTFPMASDPDRAIFNLFGNGGIPRNYVVGTDGRILYQSDGYVPSEFRKMKTVIERELKKVKDGRSGK